MCDCAYSPTKENSVNNVFDPFPASSLSIVWPRSAVLEEVMFREGTHTDKLLIIYSNDQRSSRVCISLGRRMLTRDVYFSPWKLHKPGDEVDVREGFDVCNPPLPLRGAPIRGKRLAPVDVSCLAGLSAEASFDVLSHAIACEKLRGNDGFMDFWKYAVNPFARIVLVLTPGMNGVFTLTE